MLSVIMAGGSGTRFWPVSRRNRPKQFLSIIGHYPMVVETCNRLKPLARDQDMVIVLGQAHLHQARELFKGRKIHLLAEPKGRNTAPAIGLGALYASYLGYEGAVAFLPADHYIGKPSAFLESLRQAEEIAIEGAVVTLGIVPTRPETGYGYIQWSADRPDFWTLPAYRVTAFIEKPPLEKAKQYLVRGDYFWNSGIFVATPKVILKQIEDYLPNLYLGLKKIERYLGTDAFENVIEAVYEDIDSVSFDQGVMEKTKDPVFVIPSDCGWSDVGSWASVYDLREGESDKDRNIVEGECLLVDCEGNLVSGRGGRLVACLGLKNCLVVDTRDALLIADLERSQDVRRVIELLQRNRKEDLI
jgi:mannose-1-phosphate guanylyltransferase